MIFWTGGFIISPAITHSFCVGHFLLGFRFEKDGILIHDIESEGLARAVCLVRT
jgi:hypothetical protein